MPTNPSVTPGTCKEKQVLSEIGNSEKQLWALIHSKGLLHIDTQDLYQKVRSSYERTILNNHTLSELQDVEYSLWKLHYKHIDEFRKRIKRGSGNAENTKSGAPQNDIHPKAFKSFLSEATEFYQNLIVKLRKHYGVSEEALFYKRGCISASVEPDAMLKCQYLCHRCLVCMGDLARYDQQCENPHIHNHNWSVAATHYLEATRIWPDSGNPQNQLAVLATYIGDEFLALYHCIRSLAIKEPFPDAWNNLILLFERNRSSHLPCVSNEACIDSSKPSGSSEKSEAQPEDHSKNCNTQRGQSNCFADTKIWSLMVRAISFFFIKSNLEDFQMVFASTIRELDKMMELDDADIKTMLESYEQVNLGRRGPLRAIQVVTVLIFALKHIIDKREKNETKDKNEGHQLMLIQMALYATFSFLGRFIERCLKAGPMHYCPLLPSVLVFVEWTASMLDAMEVYATDSKSSGAMSYFFGVFIDLLNQLNAYGREAKKLLDSTPLWEDYELRGFAPLTSVHASLDFSGNWQHIDNFESGIELRALRIRKAAMKIASRSTDLQERIMCDELGMKFYVAKLDESHDKKETENVESHGPSAKEESNLRNYKGNEVPDKLMRGNNPTDSITNGKSATVEEEEVILFRPLMRYNSAPLYPSPSTNEQISPKDKDDQNLPPDDCLRRATSLLMAQNQTQGNTVGFHADIANFRSDKSFEQAESSTKESNVNTFSGGSISAGPPSLNAWVLDRESFSNNKDTGANSISEHRLQPIEEIASSSLASLSINNSEDAFIISSVNQSSNFHPPSTYSSPVPSAPLLPDNAAWFNNLQSSFSPPNMPDNSLPPLSGYPDWSSIYGPVGYGPPFSAYTNGYPPPPRRLTSSEWLRWYREHYNHPPEGANNHIQPTTHYNASGIPEDFLYHDPYRFIQCDRWGNPLSSKQYTYMEPPAPPSPLQPDLAFASASAMGEQGEQMSSLFNNFQRASPYGCGAVRNEPQPLIEFLKEREWRLQRDPTIREPTFMGN